MVKRIPTNEICEMKVKELRGYARTNNISVKDKNGKMKLKCDLVIDIIKNIYNRNNINTNNNNTNKQLTDIKKLSMIVNELNRCLINYHNKYFPEKMDYEEFKPCCDENELRIIEECYEIYKQHNSNINDVTILGAIIIYYYLIVVLEYYSSNEDKKYYGYNHCINNFYKYIENITKENPRTVVDMISTSDAEYISKIRRKILRFNSRGGYKNKISKKIRKISKKNKTRRRFK